MSGVELPIGELQGRVEQRLDASEKAQRLARNKRCLLVDKFDGGYLVELFGCDGYTARNTREIPSLAIERELRIVIGAFNPGEEDRMVVFAAGSRVFRASRTERIVQDAVTGQRWTFTRQRMHDPWRFKGLYDPKRVGNAKKHQTTITSPLPL